MGPAFALGAPTPPLSLFNTSWARGLGCTVPQGLGPAVSLVVLGEHGGHMRGLGPCPAGQPCCEPVSHGLFGMKGCLFRLGFCTVTQKLCTDLVTLRQG